VVCHFVFGAYSLGQEEEGTMASTAAPGWWMVERPAGKRHRPRLIRLTLQVKCFCSWSDRELSFTLASRCSDTVVVARGQLIMHYSLA